MNMITFSPQAALDRFQSDFGRLRKADRKCEVFGASHHRYKSTPVSSRSIDTFEQDLGVELPRNYREFLIRIGYGCGPYYGIWSPSEVLSELKSCAFELDEHMSCSPSGKFPLKSVEGIQHENWPNDGCIPIGHQGCTCWTVLVLDGIFRGTVWDMEAGGIDGEWMPARRPLGLLEDRHLARVLPQLPNPPDFLEWIEGWIEGCKLDLSIR